MNLQQLLDELRQNILNDRSNSIGGDSDALWTDETLVNYIDEAQRRFAVRSFCLVDKTTPAATQVTLATDVAEYELHKSVLAVVSARLTGEDVDLARTGHSVLNAYIPPNRDSYDAQQPTSESNKPRMFTTDEGVLDDAGSFGSVTLRLYPKPSVDYNGTILNLRVVRKPINTFSTSSMSTQVPEIPTDHHMEMLDWAAHLALRINDADAGNLKRAMIYAESFESHVKEARRMVLRKMRSPTPWGFGGGGFRWGS